MCFLNQRFIFFFILIIVQFGVRIQGNNEKSLAIITSEKIGGVFKFKYVKITNTALDFCDTFSFADIPVVGAAKFINKINETGWSFLSINTFPIFPDYLQAYWAGFLETNLTYDLTKAHFKNTVEDLCTDPKSKECEKLKIYLQENLEYMIKKAVIWSPTEPFWYQVQLQLWQLKGISDAFHKKFVDNSTHLKPSYLHELKEDVLGIYLLQLSGDLSDLVRGLSIDNLLNIKNQLGHPAISHPSCSALIKVLQNDVYISHATWSGYHLMLRVIKSYIFPWKKMDSKEASQVPGIAITFTSYPSTISSIDDFFITNTQLVITETTHNVHNSSLWEYVRHGSTKSLFTFIRTMIANRLADSGMKWTDYFMRKNSGTYNNQWMVVDAKKWGDKGLVEDDGALVIAEQLPGIVSVKDVTYLLKEQSYWPSYNLPYLDNIYKLSGTGTLANQYGDWYFHNKTSRALLFRRDHHKVKDLKSMYRLMRYNNFMTDPLSKCACIPPYTGINAISSRSDLNEPHGYYPIRSFSYHLHGATDVKIVNLTMIKQMSMLATSGPTYDDVPAFQWSTLKTKVEKPLMHPDKWNFPPIFTKYIEHSISTNCSIKAWILSYVKLLNF